MVTNQCRRTANQNLYPVTIFYSLKIKVFLKHAIVAEWERFTCELLNAIQKCNAQAGSKFLVLCGLFVRNNILKCQAILLPATPLVFFTTLTWTGLISANFLGKCLLL